MAQKDWDKQIAEANARIKKNQKDEEAYFLRGVAYGEKGEFDKALAEFDKVIKLKPDHASAYRNHGVVYDRKGEHAKAIADHTKAIKLKPDYAEAYNSRGVAYNGKGEHDKAIADFDEAIKLKPDYAGAYSNRGNVYYNRDDFDKAIADYDEAIRLKPELTKAHHNRALALAGRQTKRQIEEFQQRADKQQKEQKDAFEKTLKETVDKYKKLFIEVKEYEDQQNDYREEKRACNEKMDKQRKGIYWTASICFIAVLSLPILKFFGVEPTQWIPPIGFLIFILWVQAWNLRVLNRDKNKYLALEAEMFAKRRLATLVNLGMPHESLRNDIYRLYFQHESRFNAAHLVIAAEQGKLPNTKGDKPVDNDAINPILERILDEFKKRLPKE